MGTNLNAVFTSVDPSAHRYIEQFVSVVRVVFVQFPDEQIDLGCFEPGDGSSATAT